MDGITYNQKENTLMYKPVDEDITILIRLETNELAAYEIYGDSCEEVARQDITGNNMNMLEYMMQDLAVRVYLSRWK